jgi:hypothetical protein
MTARELREALSALPDDADVSYWLTPSAGISRNCQHCGVVFIPHRPNQIRCRVNCGAAARMQVWRDAHRAQVNAQRMERYRRSEYPRGAAELRRTIGSP